MRWRRDERGEYGAAITAGVLVAVLLVGGITWLTGTASTQRDEQCLSYGDGPFEGKHFQGVVEGGRGMFFNGLGDRLYCYPTTQRNYIISLNEKEGDRKTKDSIHAAAQDGIDTIWQVAAFFKLNLGLEQRFHEQIGLKYSAWDWRDAGPDSGWDRMLNDSLRQQVENAIQVEARQYPARDLYDNRDVLAKVQTDIASVLKERVAAVLGGEYFCGPTYTPGGTCGDIQFVVKHVDVPDSQKQTYDALRAAQTQVETEKQKVLQARQQAEAIRITNEAFAKFGNAYFYVLLKAIESGKIDFWVLPNNGQITLPNPNGKQGSP